MILYPYSGPHGCGHDSSNDMVCIDNKTPTKNSAVAKTALVSDLCFQMLVVIEWMSLCMGWLWLL